MFELLFFHFVAAIPMYPIIVAVLVVALIAALVFIIVVFYRKRKKEMNSQPCKIQQNQINTDNVYFSNSNIEHYTEITNNSIPIVYENINDNKTISCEPQNIVSFQQKGNNTNHYHPIETQVSICTNLQNVYQRKRTYLNMNPSPIHLHLICRISKRC